MKIDEYLNERLTIDSHADKMEENYRGLMEIGGHRARPDARKLYQTEQV